MSIIHLYSIIYSSLSFIFIFIFTVLEFYVGWTVSVFATLSLCVLVV